MTEDQSRIVEALESGRVRGAPGPLRRIDTHMSHVFLGRDRVFKLKRAVRMPFVDFSTLEARRAACETELEVNRRFASRLYLGVEPIIRDEAGGFRLGGPGAPADWLVVMRPFAAGALFDEMARAGVLTTDLVGQAADKIAVAHAAAEVVRDAGRPDYYLAIARGLERTEADGAAAHGLHPGPDEIYRRLEQAFERAGPLIEARRRQGKVRRGHGDLHLRNLCLFEGGATAFDALEFDPALATSDVLYDLAFLLMDLRRRGLEDHANVAMNRYCDASGEAEAALALLPPFMALRATVRMAVAMEAGDSVEAGTYRALGLQLLAPQPPRLVAIGGLSGSGKSAVARRIAPRLPGVCGARLLRTDVIRKAAGAPLDADAYRPERRAEVYCQLAARAADALGAGCSALADATFQDQDARALFGAAAFTGVWLRAAPEVRLARVRARTGDASDADAAVAAAQREPELSGWTVVDAEGPLEAVVREACAALGLTSEPGV